MLHSSLLVLIVSGAVLVSCGGDKSPDGGPSAPAASGVPESLWLAAEPASPKNIIEAREAVKDGDEVTIVGKVGGDAEVFLPRRAVFTIVDLSLKNCEEMKDECATWWDYCCVDKTTLVKGSATIEFHGASGILPTGAQGFHGLDHGKTAVVKGKVRKDSQGNLIVVASGIHIRS